MEITIERVRRNQLKRIAVIAGCSLSVPLAAHAQSSVTIYGLIDTGLDYVTNVGGKNQVSMGTGVLSPNLFGFRASEDLGGGLSAKVVLEGQFNAATGALLGNEFGHQSYIELADAKWGSVTAGNQDDFMFTSLAVTRYGPEFPSISLQNLRQGPFNALGIPGGPAGRACQEFCVRGIKMSIRTKYATQNETIYGAAADSERVT